MPTSLPGKIIVVSPPEDEKKSSIHQSSKGKSKALRAWWQDVLRRNGRYPISSIFLCLPSDKEVIRYLKDFGIELNQISGENNLVIALSNNQFYRVGSDGELNWKIAVQEQARQGYSIRISQLFNIGVDEFPAIILFRDIRSNEYVMINLKGLNAEEIAVKMRTVFTIIDKAVSMNENPIVELIKLRRTDTLKSASRVIISEVRRVMDLSIQAAIEASIKIVSGK